MILYGASGHAKVIIDVLESQNIQVDFLFDDNETIRQLEGYPVIGQYSAVKNPEKEMVISIGDNTLRKKISELVSHNFGMAIHKTSTIAKGVDVGRGSVIFHHAVIQPGCSIGDHVIINTKASVDHDCRIGNFAHIAPGVTICGGVDIGEGSLVGAGSTLIPNISIGKWCIIGAGAVVTRSIPDYSVVVGNPGKIIRKTQP